MLLVALGKRYAIEQNMWYNTRSQPRHRIPTITACVFRHATGSPHFEHYRWLRDGHGSDRTECGNATMFDLTQITYLALCHMRGRLFDGVAKAFTLHEDHGMARLASTDQERHNAMFRPFLQWNMPGQALQSVLVVYTHVKLWISVDSWCVSLLFLHWEVLLVNMVYKRN